METQQSSSSNASRVSFIVPTLRRPDFLRRCLASLVSLTTKPAEVLVGIRSNDPLSRPVLAEFDNRLPIRAVEAKGTGVVGSMTSCLSEATGEWIALADDDVELPSDWLHIMIGHLQANPKAVGAAGRDRLIGNTEHLKNGTTLDVGRFHWYGKITGNHHRGTGPARRVDILRGSNCLFRGDFLREVGFEQALRGQGAQVHWELALALHARRKAKHLFYDPGVEVIHHVAPRHDNDQLHRGGFNAEALWDMTYNEAFILHFHAPFHMQISCITWAFLVGGGLTPGLMKALQLLLVKDPHLPDRIRAFARGWIAGLRDALAQNHHAISRT